MARESHTWARERPAVLITYLPHPGDTTTLRAVHAGLEEEGVPFRTEVTRTDGAQRMAHESAMASPLGVGIGTDQTGAICLHHGKLALDTPVLITTASQARLLGHNAARLVTGLPFKDVPPTTELTHGTEYHDKER